MIIIVIEHPKQHFCVSYASNSALFSLLIEFPQFGQLDGMPPNNDSGNGDLIDISLRKSLAPQLSHLVLLNFNDFLFLSLLKIQIYMDLP